MAAGTISIIFLFFCFCRKLPLFLSFSKSNERRLKHSICHLEGPLIRVEVIRRRVAADVAERDVAISLIRHSHVKLRHVLFDSIMKGREERRTKIGKWRGKLE